MLPHDPDDELEPDHEFDDTEWWRWYRDTDDREPTVSPPTIETIDPGELL